jgi:hypothetical protein
MNAGDSTMTFKRSLGGALLALAAVAQAQTLSSITLDPPQPKPGEPVTITIAFTNAEAPNCNVRLHYGDGKTRDLKINQAKDVPRVVTYSYDKPGNYRVMAEGKTALPMLKCVGANQIAMLEVKAPAKASGAAAAAPACPAGWKLDTKSVNKKSGAYTCGAKPNTALPAAKPECPAPLGYFENKSKGQLGCKA